MFSTNQNDVISASDGSGSIVQLKVNGTMYAYADTGSKSIKFPVVGTPNTIWNGFQLDAEGRVTVVFA